ncbi:RNB family domain containing protein [Entamoeba marina]
MQHQLFNNALADLTNFFIDSRLDSEFGQSMKKIEENLFLKPNRDSFIQEPAQVEFSNGSVIDLTLRKVITLDPLNTRIMDDGFHFCSFLDSTYEVGFHTPFFHNRNEIFNSLLNDAKSGILDNETYADQMKSTGKSYSHTLKKGKTTICMTLLVHIDEQGNILSKWYGITNILVHANIFSDVNSKWSIEELLTQINPNTSTNTSTSTKYCKMVKGFTPSDAESIINRMKSFMGILSDNGHFGKQFDVEKDIQTFIGAIGQFIRLSNGALLRKLYGNYACVNIEYDHQLCYATNRSPLRKFSDNLTNSQLYCVMKRLDIDEMIETITKKSMTRQEFKDMLTFIYIPTNFTVKQKSKKPQK